METVVLLSAAAFWALTFWLVVRISRRERWAKWTLATLLSAPTIYVLSIGPACRLCDEDAYSYRTVRKAYYPLLFVSRNTKYRGLLERYAILWGSEIALLQIEIAELKEEQVEHRINFEKLR